MQICFKVALTMSRIIVGLKVNKINKNQCQSLQDSPEFVISLCLSYISTIITGSNISKYFGETKALDQVSFSVAEGETLAVIGTSGSGKSTLLRIINRLIPVTTGEITIDGTDTREIPEIQLRRRIGYVLQQPALFPHWTAEKNIGLVPQLLGWPREKINDRVRALLELMQLPYDVYRGRYPAELSGGEQQRIAIARAMAARPHLILYDEPFSALDPLTRAELQKELLRLKKHTQITSVFVTHNVHEAFMLGDQILILHRGRVRQEGTPEEIIRHPADEFVEKFIRWKDE